jgi:hypothetical protein
MSISMAIYDQTQRPLLTGSLPMETPTKRDHSSLEMTLRFVAAHGLPGMILARDPRSESWRLAAARSGWRSSRQRKLAAERSGLAPLSWLKCRQLCSSGSDRRSSNPSGCTGPRRNRCCSASTLAGSRPRTRPCSFRYRRGRHRRCLRSRCNRSRNSGCRSKRGNCLAHRPRRRWRCSNPNRCHTFFHHNDPDYRCLANSDRIGNSSYSSPCSTYTSHRTRGSFCASSYRYSCVSWH